MVGPDDVPLLPPGRPVELPGRGVTFVRELPGPPGAPTLVLLHGWTATADLNWLTCYGTLGRSYHVVALDHRGHGRGIRAREPFRLEDCADDAVALADVLGVERFVAVGYSMGGPIAMLTWRQHPHRVSGLVLCATSRGFNSTREERINFLSLGGLARAARLTPAPARNWVTNQVIERHGRARKDWALRQIRRHDWAMVLEAGQAIGEFSARGWIGEVDVPTAVIVTRHDLVVPPRRQERLAASIPGAHRFDVDGGHDAVVAVPSRFVPTLLRACATVVAHSAPRQASPS